MSVDEQRVGAFPAGSRSLGGPLSRLRQAVEYAAFRIIAWLAAAIPLDICASMSAWCWRKAGRFNSRHRRAMAQLEAAMPALSLAQREAVVEQVFDNLGRVFAETFHLDAFHADASRFEMRREKELRGFIADHPRLLIVSLHSANWELAALGCQKAGLRIAGIYQALKNPLVDAYVTRLRRPLYPAALLPKSRDTPRRFIKLVREGVPVAMMSDLREARGLDVPFFGRLAPSTSFPALLAVAHGLPILAVRTLRLPGSRFAFDWRPLAAETALPTREANVEATTALIQGCFENWIRERPGEWMWIHRRWW